VNGALPLPRITTTNHWMQTYQLLREHILERKLGPNEKLITPTLANQLGVSPTPIRDALNRLEAEGLVRTIPKVGTFVTSIDGNNVVDITDSRRMIEHWVVEKLHLTAANRITRTIDRLEAIVEQSRKHLDRGELEIYTQSRLDYDFHMELVTLGGNAKNAEMYKSLMRFSYYHLGGKLLTLDKFLASVAQHQNIVDALKRADTATVKEQISIHLDYSRDNLLEAIAHNGGFL